jgi:hypothetical protein
MRLKQRSSVLLPQPLGPINAVTLCSSMGIETLLRLLNSP